MTFWLISQCRSYIIQHRVSSIEYRLDPVTPDIRQFIIQAIIDAVFIIRQRIFSVAGPATQADRVSGSMYLEGCLALAAPEKSTLHHLDSLIQTVNGENTA